MTDSKMKKKKEEDSGELLRSTGSNMRLYGLYSTIVFQMLATMGISFWGGKKLNDYLGVSHNLLTIVIGLSGIILAFYNLLRQLKNIQDNEK